MLFEQSEYIIRFEWSMAGLQRLLPGSDVIVIVDVLSFSTCIDIGVTRGAYIYPYWGEGAEAYARSVEAELAGRRGDPAARYSLSPASLLSLPAGARLVLPSPNGSRLSLAAGEKPVLAGCLRNARSVARAVEMLGERVAVIAAGERWEDGGLRPGLEDLLGAGAIISRLAGTKSPEARAAEAAFREAQGELQERLAACGSGQELIARSYPQDVALAGELDASDTAPRLQERAYYSIGS